MYSVNLLPGWLFVLNQHNKLKTEKHDILKKPQHNIRIIMRPAEKLAESLEILRALQKNGPYAIQSKALSRTHRERLLANGFLQEVIKGWYIPSKPDEKKGETTAWYASFWSFCASYLNERFHSAWCLSPEQSLLLHAENWTVPQQLLVRTPHGTNHNMQLLHDTSLFQLRLNLPSTEHIELKNGLRLYTIPSALIYCSPKFFSQHSTEARAILAMFNDASALLHLLLEEGHSTIAGRLCGAFKNIGKAQLANDIRSTMEQAGYQVREEDPFSTIKPIDFSILNKPPYCRRLEVMWQQMRQSVIEHFPNHKKNRINTKKYLEKVEESFTNDAYHSLSIEGYQVSPELINKVRSGHWNPNKHEEDKEIRNALAARGYWQAFKAVEKSLVKVLAKENPGEVVKNDHSSWYRELFQPSVAIGLLKPIDFAGYRQGPVFIRQSKHIPPRAQIVGELMNEFFQLIQHEENLAVRIVLGHFFFVYIHPYPDGNGRIARFLMNVMFAADQLPWIIIPVERRSEYMDALEQASVYQDIVPFCNFIASCSQ